MKKVYWVVGVLVGVAIAGLLLLSYGNPQASKYVFMWQVYVWPKFEAGPSGNFTGTWRTWYSNGQLWSEDNYVNGLRHGKSRMFLENGLMFVERDLIGDQFSGLIKYYDMEEGYLLRVVSYRNGLTNGIGLVYSPKGDVLQRRLERNNRSIMTFKYSIGEILDQIRLHEYGDSKTLQYTWKIVYDKSENVDKRSEYTKEIAEFKTELAKFEKEHLLKETSGK